MTRSEAREQAFKLVFNRMFNKQSTADEIINNMTEAGEYEPIFRRNFLKAFAKMFRTLIH